MQTSNPRAFVRRFASHRSGFVAAVLLPLLLICCPRLRAASTGSATRSALTLLSETGTLNRDVAASEIAHWKRELCRGQLSSMRVARLHLWLGEVEIARNLEPERALEQFGLAQRLARRSDPVYGCAAYDRAFTLLRHGAYALSASAFYSLLHTRPRLIGYSYTDCMLRYRHATACAGYHAHHARLGITEPPSLDPNCGIASLAACLRAAGKPSDRKTLLANCRMTGLGNNMQDLIDGAKRLGMSAWAVCADEAGLKVLPKPLVAHVEEDHFIAVTRADKDGVSYLCSDCGAWPGGRRDLTWKQWRAMDCSLYLVVTEPHSAEDDALQALRPGSGRRQAGVRAQGVRLAGLRSGALASARARTIRLLGAHTTLYLSPTLVQCTLVVTSLHCPGCQSSCPMASASGGGGSDGPSSGDPVDLATGEEEYQPPPDLTVYNPIGPSVVWQREWQSLRGPSGSYQLAFGYGWSTGYDLNASVSGTQISLAMPNGAAYVFNAPSTPSMSNPKVNCPSAVAGVAILCTWYYLGDDALSLVFTWADRSQWVFSQDSINGYNLTKIMDRNGNAINFAYGGRLSLLAAITDNNGRPLMKIQRNTIGNITSVSDRYGRSVYYGMKLFSSPRALQGAELIRISQVVRTGTPNPPYRCLLGFAYNPGDEVDTLALRSITVPSPTGHGVSTATISYTSAGYVSSTTDGNGNTTTYSVIDANDTRVTVTDAHNNVVTGYTVNFDPQMRTLSATDGTNKTLVYQASYSGNGSAVYAGPSQVTDGNNNVMTYTYDQYGQVQSVTSPRNVTTTFTRDYNVFPLGKLGQIQEGSKSATTVGYYEPSGLVRTITTPTPGTSGAPGVVTTIFTYDALGNVLTVTRPGNDTTAAITATLNYTQDGAYSQPDAIGQPLTVTDNLGHITHFRYDAQGNTITAVDALGNRTDNQFNQANELTQTLAPAIGDITAQIGVTRSQLTYVAASKTYNGTITLTNTGGNGVHGYLLAALTNLASGVSLANTSGTYVNSPTLLSGPVNLASGGSTTLNVSFNAPSSSVVNYGVQTYLADSQGNPAVHRSETQILYLYPGGPVRSVNLYDETGALVRQVSIGYGKEGEQLSVAGSTEPVSYSYDGAYRLQALADGNGNATHYAYNTAGWLQSVTYPAGDGMQFPSYDPAGHVLKRIDGRGIETDYIYNDPESLLTNVHYVNSASYPSVSQYNVTVDYDGYGRAQDVFDFSGHTHFDYDDLNTQTEIDTTYAGIGGAPALPTVSLTYAFNPDGSRHGMNVQTSTTSYDFTYGYDAAGRPALLTNPFSETTQWSYLANNWLASQTYANGVTAFYAYNRRGSLNDLTQYAANGMPLSDFGAMTYDSAANRLTKSVAISGAPGGYSGQTAYTNDIKDQLLQEQSTLGGGYNNAFNYDQAGNPLSFKGTSHGFNADNQFTDSGFAYDGEGNPTTYQGTSLTFDPEDCMTAFGSSLAAGYRADGLRAWKQSTTGVTYFVYDGITPVCELNGSGSMQAVNTFGASGLESRSVASASTFYTFDPQGSVTQRLGADGSVLASMQFDAFGAVASTSSTSNPYGYGAQWGYYTDAETGLQALGHRYYDPSAGRFVTRDPIGQSGGVNPYAYCFNQPDGRADPDGFFWHIVAGAGIGALVGGLTELGTELLSGQDVNWRNVAGAAIGGAVQGGLIAAFGPGASLWASTIGAAVGNLAKQGLNWKCDSSFSWKSLGTDILVGFVTGSLSGKATAWTKDAVIIRRVQSIYKEARLLGVGYPNGYQIGYAPIRNQVYLGLVDNWLGGTFNGFGIALSVAVGYAE